MQPVNINTSLWARIIARSLWFPVLCLLSGCLSRPALRTQTFAFDPPADSAPKRTVQSERVVGIRSVRVAPPFDDRSLVYRLGDFSYQADPYAEFLASPEESLRAPIRSWMRESDLFRTVVEPGSALKPNSLAEVTILELYGDFRHSQEPAAVLTLRFVLLDAPDGIPEKLAFEKEYTRRVPLKAKNPNVLMSGWADALNQILAQLGSDLRRQNAPGSP